ncbi:putative u2 snrnp component ist3 protein [Lasiodiplodia theobromae]|nr:putative u2 snrnp component ist3 protein [Lasiodiplodia theobromae]
MNKIRQVKELNKRELEAGITPEGSWHADYRDTAFIYIGGLPYDVSEGDIVTIFSQYGEPVYVNLVRDKETGKSKGFAFLKYEDQRSCDLAVDNMSGAQVMGRIISVDHTRYKKKEGEELRDNTYGAPEDEDEGTGAVKKAADTESESEEESRPVLKEERELAELLRNHDDDDPMKAYLIKEKKAEVEEAIKEWKAKNGGSKKKNERRKHRHHRSRRDRDEDDEERRHRRRRHRSRSPSEERSRSRERRRRDYSEDRDRKSRRRDHSEDRDRKSKRRDDSEDGERRTKRRDDSRERERRDRRRDNSRDRERKSRRRADSEDDYRRERRRDHPRDTDVRDSDRKRRSPS